MIPANHVASGEAPILPESKSDFEGTSWARLLPALVLIAGLAVRLYKAAAYFLNPDEALHLVLASQPSVRLAYKAALTNAHPPLLVLLIHYWRWLGQSEFILRLPSVVAGTACCWIAYLWVKQLTGDRAAFMGLLLLALSPTFVGLSSEVRQYALLLFLISGCLYLSDRALREKSAWSMVLFSLSLCGALLVHYSALLFAFIMGIYMLVRFYGLRKSSAEDHFRQMQLIVAWAVGQLLALAISAYFVFTHLIPLRRSGMLGPDYDTYLRKSIFHPSDRSIFGFVAVQTLRVFTYLFGDGLVGSLALLAFMAGISLLMWRKMSFGRDGPSPRSLALLLGLGFAVNCAAALARQYPYGGTRHSAWLLVFAVTGVCIGIASWAKTRFWLTSGVVTCGLIVANFFPSPAPLIRPKNQLRGLMKEAVTSFRESAPPGAVVIADYQSGLLLGYYACGHGIVQVFPPMNDFVRADCGSYTVITPSSRDFRFYGENIADRLGRIAREYKLNSGTKVWFFDAGWITDSAPALEQEMGKLGCSPHKFGENIFWCPIVMEDSPSGLGN
jgi:hypothetical protein